MNMPHLAKDWRYVVCRTKPPRPQDMLNIPFLLFFVD